MAKTKAASLSNKLTPKQEKFCYKYIETGNASEAYRQSYDAENMKPATINRKAKGLLDNGKIGARLRTLYEASQKRHDVTVDSLTEELDENRELARSLLEVGHMNTATMGKAKLHGLMTDKKDFKVDPKDLNMKVEVEFVDPPPRPTE